jgi:hypothetical protein
LIQMAQLRAWYGGEAAGAVVIGFALEFDRADETAAGPGTEPALDEREKPPRVAHDIGKQPVDVTDRVWIEREGALAPMFDAGQARDFGRERRLVDADH